MPEITLTLHHSEGLHARPAAIFVKKAQEFNSDIRISLDGWDVNAKSILEVLALGANKGSSITISCTGVDEEEAIKSLEDVIKNNFGDPIEEN